MQADRQRDHFRRYPIQAKTLVPLVAEYQRLAMFQHHTVIVAHPLAGCPFEDTVVEDVAVLVDLDERCPLVRGCPLQNFHHVHLIRVDGTGDLR